VYLKPFNKRLLNQMTIVVTAFVRARPWLIPYANVAFPILSGLLCGIVLQNITWSLWLPLEVIIALLHADFTVGLVHMITDKLKLSEEHHDHPNLLVTDRIWERSGDNILFGYIYFYTLSWLFPPLTNIIAIGAFLGAHSNEYHRFQHMGHKAPWFIKKLWSTRLVMDPNHHHIHHIAAHQTQGAAYCILLGYTEPLVVLCEKGIDLLFGKLSR
jgi:hypothetical protein